MSPQKLLQTFRVGYPTRRRKNNKNKIQSMCSVIDDTGR